MLKKIYSVIVFVCTLLSIFALTAFADSNINHKHNFSNGVCTICNEKHQCNYEGTEWYVPGICQCGHSEKDFILNKPNTNLDFWIGDIIDDLSSLDNDYYYTKNKKFIINKKYTPISVYDDGMGEPPIHFVGYVIEPYENKHIVQKIVVYDPLVYIDNVTIQSPRDVFFTWAKNNNIEIVYDKGGSVSAQTGRYSIGFGPNDCMMIEYSKVYFPDTQKDTDDQPLGNPNDELIIDETYFSDINPTSKFKSFLQKHIYIIVVVVGVVVAGIVLIIRKNKNNDD